MNLEGCHFCAGCITRIMMELCYIAVLSKPPVPEPNPSPRSLSFDLAVLLAVSVLGLFHMPGAWSSLPKRAIM